MSGGVAGNKLYKIYHNIRPTDLNTTPVQNYIAKTIIHHTTPSRNHGATSLRFREPFHLAHVVCVVYYIQYSFPLIQPNHMERTFMYLFFECSFHIHIQYHVIDSVLKRCWSRLLSIMRIRFTFMLLSVHRQHTRWGVGCRLTYLVPSILYLRKNYSKDSPPVDGVRNSF